MHKRRKKASTLDVGKFTADSSIARANAVRLIAMRIRKFGDTDRQARNRVSKRIGYAIEKGKLWETSRGIFVFGDLVRWTWDEWPGSFDDLPVRLRHVVANTPRPLSLGSFSLRSRAVGLPGDLPTTIRERNLDLYSRIDELEAALEAAHAEVENLRPDAERWRAQVAHLRKIGKGGGRGRSK